MKSKKTAPKKQNNKKPVAKLQSHKVGKATPKKQSSKASKTVPKVAKKKAVEQKTSKKKIEVIKPSTTRVVAKKIPNLATKLGLFDSCIKKNGRIFLKPPREFADFPDLLSLQKK